MISYSGIVLNYKTPTYDFVLIYTIKSYIGVYAFINEMLEVNRKVSEESVTII